MQDTVISLHSLSVLLSVVETSHKTQTDLVLAWWLSSELIRTHDCPCAVYTNHSYYLKAVFTSLRASTCAATIELFKATSIYRNISGVRLYCNVIVTSHMQAMCHIFIQRAGELELCHTAQGTAVVCDIQERQLKRKHLLLQYIIYEAYWTAV